MQYSVAEHRQGLERPPPRVALRWGCLDLLLARAGPAQLLYVDSDAVVPLEVFAATSSRPLFRCQLLFGSLPLTLGIAYGHQSSEWCCGVTGQHFVELSKSEKGFTLSRQLDLLYLSWVSFCLLAAMGGTVMCSGSRTAGVLTIPKNAGSLWPGMGRAPSRHAELAPGSEVSPCPWE